MTDEPRIESVEARAFEVPTEEPESDGTLEWRATTLVLAQVKAGGQMGTGYTYADRAAVALIRGKLAASLSGTGAFQINRAWMLMRRAVRNLGQTGLTAMAISAVDVALWDLKARLLGLPLVHLMGAERSKVALYASGGFTSYSIPQLEGQLGGWASEGFSRVKMKVGRDPERDPERVRAARRTIGDRISLFVDGNGAYHRKQALALARTFAGEGVAWFEEPVTSDDLVGLRLVRDRAPAPMQVAAGEYGFDLPYFERMLAAGAVDVLQADATRCGGYTAFLRVAALCDARSLQLSAHTAPALHLPVCCAAPRLAHLELFHDHRRLEDMLFDGVAQPRDGALEPDLGRPGLGLELKERDAARFAV